MSTVVQPQCQWVLQREVYETLTTAHGSTPVYDYVPESTPLPYTTIGLDTVREWNTKTSVGWEITLTIDHWSDYYGRKEAKDMLNVSTQALTATPVSLTADGWTVVDEQPEFGGVNADDSIPGQLTYHGQLRMRYLIDKT